MSSNNTITDTLSKVGHPGVDTIILLTATINPRNVPFLARNDPKIRLKDYKEAIRLWLCNPYTPPIIFAENSGYDLNEIKNLYKIHNPHNTTIEFISFKDNGYDRTLGKGYGELRIIDRALRDSQIIRPNSKLIKITGRLYVSNIHSLIQAIHKYPDVEVFCDLRCNLTWADSRAFCASKQFFTNFMIPMQEKINDAVGMTFEHVLGRAVHRCMAEGFQWAMMPCAPNFFGVSATSNRTYSHSKFSLAKREVFRRIKSMALAR